MRFTTNQVENIKVYVTRTVAMMIKILIIQLSCQQLVGFSWFELKENQIQND